MDMGYRISRGIGVGALSALLVLGLMAAGMGAAER
jgi:hypothetical protein